MTLKTFVYNLSGTHELTVAAPTRLEAAKLLRTSDYQLKGRGFRTSHPETCYIAESDPKEVYNRRFGLLDWTKGYPSVEE